jgi:hypothetical protein
MARQINQVRQIRTQREAITKTRGQFQKEIKRLKEKREELTRIPKKRVKFTPRKKREEKRIGLIETEKKEKEIMEKSKEFEKKAEDFEKKAKSFEEYQKEKTEWKIAEKWFKKKLNPNALKGTGAYSKLKRLREMERLRTPKKFGTFTGEVKEKSNGKDVSIFYVKGRPVSKITEEAGKDPISEYFGDKKAKYEIKFEQKGKKVEISPTEISFKQDVIKEKDVPDLFGGKEIARVEKTPGLRAPLFSAKRWKATFGEIKKKIEYYKGKTGKRTMAEEAGLTALAPVSVATDVGQAVVDPASVVTGAYSLATSPKAREELLEGIRYEFRNTPSFAVGEVLSSVSLRVPLSKTKGALKVAKKELPPRKYNQLLKFWEDTEKLKSQRLFVPTKKVDFTGMNRLPTRVHNPTKKFLRDKGDILGGSIAMRTMLHGKAKPKLSRWADSDLDIYTSGNVMKRAKDLSEIYRRAGVERVSVPPGSGRVTIDGKKAVEFHPYSMLKNNIKEVIPIYEPASFSIRKTPEGIRVAPILDVQARRKLVGSFLDERYSKDMPDFFIIKAEILEAIKKQKALKLEEPIKVAKKIGEKKKVMRRKPVEKVEDISDILFGPQKKKVVKQRVRKEYPYRERKYKRSLPYADLSESLVGRPYPYKEGKKKKTPITPSTSYSYPYTPKKEPKKRVVPYKSPDEFLVPIIPETPQPKTKPKKPNGIDRRKRRKKKVVKKKVRRRKSKFIPAPTAADVLLGRTESGRLPVYSVTGIEATRVRRVR